MKIYGLLSLHLTIFGQAKCPDASLPITKILRIQQRIPYFLEIVNKEIKCKYLSNKLL